jgi:hypothetical protein
MTDRRKAAQNYVNHVVFVLDASSSMYRHRENLIKVADAEIAFLAQRSKELNQETRVTVYTFSSVVECVIYDMDVLRLPSMATFYEPSGMTALVDATRLSIDDLAMTPEKYGDHAFLIWVLTDGIENASKNRTGLDIKINSLPGHWTVAALVPDVRGKIEAKRFGFSEDNIAIWDPNSSQGIQEVGHTIRQANESFMTGRAEGVRGTRSMFSTGADAVNAQTIQQAGLTPLPPSSYVLVPIPSDDVIKPFVERTGHQYVTGKAYYQLSKPEKIQPQKSIIVVEKNGGRAYSGTEARSLIGLPDMHVTVRPNWNPDYDIYVQSTSVNRNLKAGTRLLLML